MWYTEGVQSFPLRLVQAEREHAILLARLDGLCSSVLVFKDSLFNALKDCLLGAELDSIFPVCLSSLRTPFAVP
jgi:hypothetical protein